MPRPPSIDLNQAQGLVDESVCVEGSDRRRFATDESPRGVWSAGSMRRTYTPRRWLADIVALTRATPRLLAIYGGGRLDPALRERVMVAVSRANGCRGCTSVHEAWALRAGVSAEELEQIGAGDFVSFSMEDRAAIVYATALAEAGFGEIPADIQALVDGHLDRRRQGDVEAVARVITLANLSVNTTAAVAGHSALRRIAEGCRR